MPNRSRTARIRNQLLLVVALLLAQVGATAHQLDHVSDLYDQACLVCVITHNLDQFSGAPALPATAESALPAIISPAIDRLVPLPSAVRPPNRGPPASIHA